MDQFFIFGAKYLVFLSPLITGAYFLHPKTANKKEIVMFFLVLLPLAFLFSLIARELYFNPRPFVAGDFEPLIPHQGGNGFPSDHTLLASALAAGMTVFSRRTALFLWIIALVVGYSRIYVGVHHPIDIAGSIAITSFSAGVAYLSLKLFKSDRISQ